MQTHYLLRRSCRALLAGFMLLATCLGAQGESPTLSDFGFGHLLNLGTSLQGRALPLGQRACLVVMLDTLKNGQFPQTAEWYNHAVFDFGRPAGFSFMPANSYFLENSSGRFVMVSTGAGANGIGVVGPLTLNASEQAAFNNALVNGNLTPVTGQVALSAAVRAGFPLADFDLNHDGVVDYGELMVVTITNTVPLYMGQPTGGQTNTCSFTPPGSGITANCCVSALNVNTYATRPSTASHEMTHNVANMFDLYYNAMIYDGTTQGLLAGFTIAADGIVEVGLDPYHKFTAGWISPRLVEMHRGGRFYLKAAQLGDPTSPLILYDASHGTHEFFLLEFRAASLGGYDSGFVDQKGASKGVVLWHVTTGTDSQGNDYQYIPNTLTLFGLKPPGNVPNTNRVEGPPYPNKNQYLQPDVAYQYNQSSERLRWNSDPDVALNLAPAHIQVEANPGDNNGVWVDILPDALGNDTWTGNAGSNGSGKWIDDGNWSAGPPQELSAVTFGASATTNVAVSLKSYDALANPPLTPLALHTLTLAPGAPAYHFTFASDVIYSGGSSYTGYLGSVDFVGAGIVNNSGQTQTFSLGPAQAVIGANADTVSFYAQPANFGFYNVASAGAQTAFDVPGGNVTLVKKPMTAESLLRGPGNTMTFHDRATAGGSTITLRGGSGNGSLFSSLRFSDASTAGAATVTAEGGIPGRTFTDATPNPCDGVGGQIFFSDSADAGTAHLTTLGENHGTGGTGGGMAFRNTSNAAKATITNTGSGFAGGYGGATYFHDATNAGNAQIINNPALAQNGGGSFTSFRSTSSAGSATISNFASPTYGFAGGGTTYFSEQATADHATFNNGGAITTASSAGEIDFHDTTTAASAVFNNLRGSNYGGVIRFYDQSTAAISTILNGVESNVDNGPAVIFVNNSTAGTATIINGLTGGRVEFHDNATASLPTPGHPRSIISLIGLADNNSSIAFFDNASAVNTSLTLRGSGCYFRGHSTADHAAIALRPAAGIQFLGDATTPRVSAANSSIVADGGAGDYRQASIEFNNWSTADHATFTLNGGTAPGYAGAAMNFYGNAQAANATIIVNPASYSDSGAGAGASCEFRDSATGDNARLVAFGGSYYVGGGYFNFQQHGNSGVPISVGSIEGSGGFYLSGAKLTVGTLNTSTVVDGGLYDVANTGGTLTKVGTGTLTLNGVNTYTGDTTVSQGALAMNGSVKGNVIVQYGATLQGTGTILGALTAQASSHVAPGNSAGTLTVTSVVADLSATLDIEGGASTGDKLVATGNAQLPCLINLKLLPGATVTAFNREIIAVGGTLNAAGLRIGSVPAGLNPNDFALTVANGHVTLQYGATASGGSYAFFKSTNFTPAQQADPAVSGPTADPDRDGIPNAVEYALGSDPNSAGGGSPFTTSVQPASTSPGAPKVLTLNFSVPQNPPADATLNVRQGTDLATAGMWPVLVTRSSTGTWTINGGSITQGSPVNGRIPVTIYGSLQINSTEKAFLGVEAKVP